MPNSVTTRSYGKAKVCLQVGQWKGIMDFLVVPMDSWDMVLSIDFIYELNMTVNMKAEMLMIMDEACPCMVSFVRRMSTNVALSLMWVV